MTHKIDDDVGTLHNAEHRNPVVLTATPHRCRSTLRGAHTLGLTGGINNSLQGKDVR